MHTKRGSGTDKLKVKTRRGGSIPSWTVYLLKSSTRSLLEIKIRNIEVQDVLKNCDAAKNESTNGQFSFFNKTFFNNLCAYCDKFRINAV